MSSTRLWLYLLASVLLLMGHVTRALRWRLLFPAQSKQDRFSLLLGLSLGYAINSIMPLRLGELARVLLVARRLSERIALVLSTVVVERLVDLAVVALLLFGRH